MPIYEGTKVTQKGLDLIAKLLASKAIMEPTRYG